ncbi:bifunctional lysylphosphatidylglycerol synthetase/lysine--tRNA ligase LysX [Streptomyces sp. A7024]|uniref:Lysine--tRNA ligase n=1 Tax=Streptomyces coryli TaxID=1128680 RepID=A0A6G4TT51_9ACTN|nr:bifunctional lysylphosphatidylglycerol synthetase/lysine--tRNA ligase LysX [Streptomyces coryli]NGN62983.1 bifunctional lysylphosphatidylglycerol synthetase/lysine--tRNA ligase LysX [Streptomyces coryli]
MSATHGTPAASRPARLADRVPRWAGGALGTLGLYCAVTALIGPLRRLLRPVTHFIDDWIFPASPNLAYAAFLMLLAVATSARKRAAWWVLACYWGVLLAIAALVLVVEHDVGDALAPFLLAAVVLAVLLLAREQFAARVRRGAFWRALAVLAGGLALAVLAGWGLVTVFPGGLPAGQRLGWAANEVFGGLSGAHNFDGRPARILHFLLGLFGALALLAAAATLFRSQRARAGLDAEDEVRIRALLARYGSDDSLGYFATRRDRNAVFAPSGKACVTYRVEAGVCLAGGDPVGDPEAWGAAIDAWLAVARSYAWTPAAMGASEAGARAYNRARLGALQLGDEAVLVFDDFRLNDREMRGVRQAVGRVARTGMTVRIRRHRELTDAEMDEVIRLADAWRDTETERGFSMALGRLGDFADGECLLVEARTAEGNPAALLSFVPWGRDGVSLDVMRRDRSSPNGVMEFMVAQLAEQGPQLGIRRASLNFAVFRSVFEEGARIGAGPVLRLWRHLLLFFSKWWQLEALYRSNVKYRPRWLPRFLCYGEPGALGRISLAAGIAEGFVDLPWRREAPRTGVRPPAALGELPPLSEEEVAAAHGIAPLVSAPSVRPPEQVRVRLDKLARLRAAGVDPYPVTASRTHTLDEIRRAHPGLAAGSRTGDRVRVAGRVLLVRDHGGIAFLALRDWSGDLQLVLSRDGAGADGMAQLAGLDLGDHIEADGEVGTTDRGELSVFVTSWRLTGKCLHPLPDKRRGLADAEARVRRRYVDLAVNPAARDVVRTRSTAVQALRQGLLDRGYLEVETPMLQQVHGGANARPFTTHINAYDLDLYLRIAPELYLKRLCVGGMEKVFELGRTFRNEGTSYKHNPEFTMLEAYQAFADYDVMLDLTRELIQGAATAAYGSPVARRTDEDGKVTEHDLAGEWPVRTVYGSISEALGEEVEPGTPDTRLRALCDRAQVPYTDRMGHGDLILEMYERLVEERTQLPVFYKDFPTDVSPLTRKHRTDDRLAERWDLVAFGTELGTAYSELTDPVDQRRRLTEQSLLAAGGDPEAMELDEDFLTALEYAMPPTGGLGIGVDRLVMFLTGLSIRETLPFPLVRRR